MAIQTRDTGAELVILPELLEAERRSCKRRGRVPRSEDDLRRMLLAARAIDDDLHARRIAIELPAVDDDDPYGQRIVAWRMDHGHDWIRHVDVDLLIEMERWS